MIHAQRPDATACAEYDFWNEKLGRYVRRGSKGIALIAVSYTHLAKPVATSFSMTAALVAGVPHPSYGLEGIHGKGQAGQHPPGAFRGTVASRFLLRGQRRQNDPAQALHRSYML